jgi:hypothetical protein
VCARGSNRALVPGPSTSPLEVTLDVVLSLGAAALFLGVIGFVRAVVEYGVPGIIAFAKLVLAPAAVVIGAFLFGPGRYEGKFPRSLLPSNQALQVIFFVVLAFTGVAFAMSAAFGVAWLVAK